MTFIDHVKNVIQFGGCVVMGMSVAPEKYRLLLQGATNQDYLLIGPKDSGDLKFIAFRMSGGHPRPAPLTVLGLEMDAYLIPGDERVNQTTDESDARNGSKNMGWAPSSPSIF